MYICVSIYKFDGLRTISKTHKQQHASQKFAAIVFHYGIILYDMNRLLDLLADRKNKSGKSGKVLMNGQRRPTNYKSIVGYVVQVR